jgi:rare lipoprotein A
MKHTRSALVPVLLLGLSLGCFGCATVHPLVNLDLEPNPSTAVASPVPPVSAQVGRASFYGHGFHGRETASGVVFDQEAMTAAHRTLAFGTRVRVTNLANGNSVVVTVNDRGPYVRGRMIDLSLGAARALGFVEEGTTRVRVKPLS